MAGPRVAGCQGGRNALPDTTTANAWVDPSTGDITVGVTDDSNYAAVKQELAERGVEDVRLVEVVHSQEELDDIVQNVYDVPGMDDISSAMHDYQNNSVLLTSRSPVTEELRAAVGAAFGDAAVLASDPVSNEPASREADTSPFYAGGWLGRTNASGPHCTVGFSWVGATGNPYMLTAGHCYPQGTNYSAATNYGSGSYTYTMGHVVRSTVDSGGTVGSDGDLALINTEYTIDGDRINRSGVPPERRGCLRRETTSTTNTTVNSVDSWTSNGTAVCYSGMKRGVQCGTDVQDGGDGGFNVQDENYSYESSDGRQWNNVALATKGWGNCPIPGDSGSPVYINTAGVGVAAHGILQGSGGGGDDYYVGKYEPSNCRMVFTEIGQAYQAFNGNVETS